MKVQAAQEYLGQQIHAVNRVTEWSEYLGFDTHQAGKGSTLAKLLTTGLFNNKNKKKKRRISGMAAVSNLGTFANWTGHVLAGSNTYDFGRLAWDPSQSAESINEEWTRMTFPGSVANVETVTKAVVHILNRSREVYEGYTSPLGIGFIVFGGGAYKAGHGACAPATPGPGDGPGGEVCPTSPGVDDKVASRRRRLDLRGGLDHYWVDPCTNYGCSNYSTFGLGCDRTTSMGTGTGYAGQYAPAVEKMFNSIATTPPKLLLWFHNVGWQHRMPDGRTLFAAINASHYDAVDEAAGFGTQWEALARNSVGEEDKERHAGVSARFAQQLRDAKVMRDHIVRQYTRWMRGGSNKLG